MIILNYNLVNNYYPYFLNNSKESESHSDLIIKTTITDLLKLKSQSKIDPSDIMVANQLLFLKNLGLKHIVSKQHELTNKKQITLQKTRSKFTEELKARIEDVYSKNIGITQTAVAKEVGVCVDTLPMWIAEGNVRVPIKQQKAPAKYTEELKARIEDIYSKNIGIKKSAVAKQVGIGVSTLSKWIAEGKVQVPIKHRKTRSKFTEELKARIEDIYSKNIGIKKYAVAKEVGICVDTLSKWIAEGKVQVALKHQKSRSKFTKELKDRIEDIYSKNIGITQMAVAKQVGVSISTLSKWIAEGKVQVQIKQRKAPTKFTKELKNRIEDIFRKNIGITQTAVAKQIGVPNSTLSKWIAEGKLQVQIKQRKALTKFTKELKDRIEDIYSKNIGIKKSAVAKQVGVCVDTLSKWIVEGKVQVQIKQRKAPTKFTKELKDRIEDIYRKNIGITQTAVAKQIGVSNSTLSRWILERKVHVEKAYQ